MKRVIVWTSSFALLFAQNHALAGPHEEGVTAGQAANPYIQSQINTPNASAHVPNYTSTPPQAALYPSLNLSAQAQAQQLACKQTPNDPVCQAQQTALTSANTPRPAISPFDPSITAARDITRNPNTVLGSLASYYSGCTTSNVVVPPKTVSRLCNRYTNTGTYSCRRDRVVTIQMDPKPTCVADSWFVQGTVKRNGSDSMTVQGQCQMDRTDHKIHFQTYVTGGDHPSCSTGWLDFDLDMTPPEPGVPPAKVTVAYPSWDIDGCRPVHVYAEGAGCTGMSCAKTIHYFYEVNGVVGGFIPVPNSNPTTYTVNPGPGHWSIPLTFTKPARVSYTEADTWADKCPVLESAGRCTEVAAERCVEGPSTKRIEGIDVTRPCWSFERTMACTGGISNDQCAPLASAGCTASSSTCVKTDPVTQACLQYQDTYQCPEIGETVTTVSNCPSDVFCMGANCFNISQTKDADFAQAMTYMEAAREAGVYLDTDKLQVFKGEDNRCRNRLLKNCCYSNGAGAGLTNNVLFGAGSRLVYDMLMDSGNRKFLYQGMSALLRDVGFSGTFSTYGVTVAVNGTALPAGSTVLYASSAEAGTGMVIAFDPWSLAITAVIYVALSMSSCNEGEGKLAMKEGAGLCRSIGTYCSSCIRVLGKCVSCIERTTSKCCFNSKLARIINEQGRAQIKKGWGSSEGPDCSGFTVAQLQTLNFAAMDLSEFYASIVPKDPNLSAIQNQNQNRIPTCYYGQGKC